MGDGPRRCRAPRCRAQIWFAFAKGADPHRDSSMPIDHATIGADKGDLATWRDGDGVIRYRPLKDGEQPGRGELRATTHYATCAEAAVFRKCPKCRHRDHRGKVCGRLGPVTCQTITTDDGTARVRGRFPCQCGAPAEEAGP